MDQERPVIGLFIGAELIEPEDQPGQAVGRRGEDEEALVRGGEGARDRRASQEKEVQ